MTRSAFRYPGSKEKITDVVRNWFPTRVYNALEGYDLPCYCEPFIGCGAMAARILPSLPRTASVIFADLDPGIVSLWQTVLNDPDALCRRLLNFTPSVEAFQSFKDQDGNPGVPVVEAAFRKFALHQMSFSGLGAKAGGPIGGKKQRSDYAVDCRFRPERHVRDIEQQHKLLRRFASVEVIHGDFADALARVPADGFAYLDPPYFLKGGELYKHNMTPEDHERLASVLRAAPYEWVLSYDDHEWVRGAYRGWADTHEFEMTATIDTKRGAGKRRKNNELVITKRQNP